MNPELQVSPLLTMFFWGGCGGELVCNQNVPLPKLELPAMSAPLVSL